MTIVLASTSPRRYQILSLLNLPFLMVSPDGSEVATEGRSPAQEALHQARRKAVSLATRFPGAIRIGSDTLISLDGAQIGKPKDVDDAGDILRRLRGRAHEVVTAVCMLESPPPFPSPRGTRCSDNATGQWEGEGGRAIGKCFEWVETARVTMRDFTDAELEAYLATGDSLDKAGAYSVQGLGRSLIVGLDGDYPAVVGLPLRAVSTGLRELGCPVTVDVDRIYRERNFLNWRTFD